jgi:redox-sensitive bicupin YhaK (pirin superfamily)
MKIVRIYPATRTNEFGPKAIVHRSIGQSDLDSVGPFLLWDAWDSTLGHDDEPVLSPHPHRGIETLTYLISGCIRHRDSRGHKGAIGPHEAQWMTAGRGIVHNEAPARGLRTRGFQLWINLRKKDKMCKPVYRDLKNMPVVQLPDGGGSVRVVVGSSHGATNIPDGGMLTPMLYLDIELASDRKHLFEETIPANWEGILFVVEGTITVLQPSSAEPVQVQKNETLVFSNFAKGQTVTDAVITFRPGRGGCRAFLVAAEPFDEPIVRYGPFVMNTREEIQKTIQDFNNKRNGFEVTNHDLNPESDD